MIYLIKLLASFDWHLVLAIFFFPNYWLLLHNFPLLDIFLHESDDYISNRKLQKISVYWWSDISRPKSSSLHIMIWGVIVMKNLHLLILTLLLADYQIYPMKIVKLSNYKVFMSLCEVFKIDNLTIETGLIRKIHK